MSEATNPYLSVLQRRKRNLTKRLNKVEDFEKLSSLDESQNAAVAGKPTIIALLDELDALIEQLTVVSKETPTIAVSNVSNNNTLSEKDVMEIASTLKLATPPPEKKKKMMKESGMQVDTTTTTSTFSTNPNSNSNGASKVLDVTAVAVASKKEVESRVRILIRALHVCTRYAEQSSKVLPIELDYFRDLALGNAVQTGTSFSDNLKNSLRQVGQLIYVSAIPFYVIFFYNNLFFYLIF
jgi:hypothetical protein